MLHKNNYIAKALTGLLFSVSVFLIGCSSGPVIQSQWEGISTVNQQSEKDWGPTLKPVNDKTSLYFASKNDSQYVTFRFVTNNMLDVMKILRSGLVLTIKSDGNSNFSIRYPLRKTDEGPRQEGFSPEQGPRDSEERVKADIQKQDEFELLDEKDNPVSSYYISNATDIKPQIQYQSGQLIYQVQIPLGRKVDKYMNISINPGSALAVKAATPEMKRPVGRSGGRGGEGAPSDGEGDGMPGGGMGGGGMHGGGRGGRGHGGPGGAGMANAGRDMTPIDLEFSVQLQNGATK